MNEKFMLEALKEAEKAFKEDEVPVGAVIVLNDKIIAKAHNKRERSHLATAHAEILAINKACKEVGDWRLENAEMYVTLEPCVMCAGAIVNSRIKKLYFGAFDQKSGAVATLYNITSDSRLNHRAESEGGILEKECVAILKRFFQLRR